MLLYKIKLKNRGNRGKGHSSSGYRFPRRMEGVAVVRETGGMKD